MSHQVGFHPLSIKFVVLYQWHHWIICSLAKVLFQKSELYLLDVCLKLALCHCPVWSNKERCFSFLVSFVISSTKNCLYDRWISLLVFEEFFLLHWYFSIVGFAESAMWLITCLVIEDICLLDGWTYLLVFEDVFYFSWICQVCTMTN
jgi:hypothetical protein